MGQVVGTFYVLLLLFCIILLSKDSVLKKKAHLELCCDGFNDLAVHYGLKELCSNIHRKQRATEKF